MASFTVEIDGNLETIEFKDDLTWGDTQQILKSCVDISNPQALKVNIQLYQQMVLQAAVTKAPFDFKNLTALNNLPAKTVTKIMSEVMKVFPLETLIIPWITAMTGEDSIESLMKSMSGVP
jgi:hypothetical protein